MAEPVAASDSIAVHVVEDKTDDGDTEDAGSGDIDLSDSPRVRRVDAGDSKREFAVMKDRSRMRYINMAWATVFFITGMYAGFAEMTARDHQVYSITSVIQSTATRDAYRRDADTGTWEQRQVLSVPLSLVSCVYVSLASVIHLCQCTCFRGRYEDAMTRGYVKAVWSARYFMDSITLLMVLLVLRVHSYSTIVSVCYVHIFGLCCLQSFERANSIPASAGRRSGEVIDTPLMYNKQTAPWIPLVISSVVIVCVSLAYHAALARPSYESANDAASWAVEAAVFVFLWALVPIFTVIGIIEQKFSIGLQASTIAAASAQLYVYVIVASTK